MRQIRGSMQPRYAIGQHLASQARLIAQIVEVRHVQRRLTHQNQSIDPWRLGFAQEQVALGMRKYFDDLIDGEIEDLVEIRGCEQRASDRIEPREQLHALL